MQGLEMGVWSLVSWKVAAEIKLSETKEARVIPA